MLNNIVGYQGFNSYGNKPYSILKPGQTQLERDYYKDATQEKPNGETIMKNFGRFQSVYD
jgi:Tfp pilus assembly protein PilF